MMIIRRWQSMAARGLMGCALIVGTAGVASADAPRVTSLEDVVRIEDVQSNEGEVRGRVVNETGDQLEDVRLLVSDQFLWRNERHPGPDSPSDAHAVSVPGPIPPHGAAAFTFKRPAPLDERHEGRFVTDVTPVEATRRPVTIGSAENTRTYERRTYEEER